MLLLISKMKLSIYIKFKVNKHSYLQCIWVISKCFKNLFSYLWYFGVIDRVLSYSFSDYIS